MVVETWREEWYSLHRWWGNGWNCFALFNRLKAGKTVVFSPSLFSFSSLFIICSVSCCQFFIFLYLFWLQDGQEMIGWPLQDCTRFRCWQGWLATWMKRPAIDLYRDLLQVQFSCWDCIYSLHKSLRHLSASFYFRCDWSMVLENWVWECVGKRKAKGHSFYVHFVLFLRWF